MLGVGCCRCLEDRGGTGSNLRDSGGQFRKGSHHSVNRCGSGGAPRAVVTSLTRPTRLTQTNVGTVPTGSTGTTIADILRPHTGIKRANWTWNRVYGLLHAIVPGRTYVSSDTIYWTGNGSTRNAVMSRRAGTRPCRNTEAFTATVPPFLAGPTIRDGPTVG